MRGRSYSPSPPRHYRSSKHRSPSPRGRYGGHGSDGPTSLLVGNLRHDCREPRGFGFVQYVEPADAEDAKYHMDGQILLGRELTVVFAEENRKKPQEMRQRERVRGRSYDKKRSPQRYGRSYSKLQIIIPHHLGEGIIHHRLGGGGITRGQFRLVVRAIVRGLTRDLLVTRGAGAGALKVTSVIISIHLRCAGYFRS